jgi:hypothetical protein
MTFQATYGTPQQVTLYPAVDVATFTGNPTIEGEPLVAGNTLFLGASQTTDPTTNQGFWTVPVGGGAWIQGKALASFTASQLPLYIMATAGTTNKNVVWMVNFDSAGTAFTYTNTTAGGETPTTITGNNVLGATKDVATNLITSWASVTTASVAGNDVLDVVVEMVTTTGYQVITATQQVPMIQAVATTADVSFEIVGAITYTTVSTFTTEVKFTIKNTSATTASTASVAVVLKGL